MRASKQKEKDTVMNKHRQIFKLSVVIPHIA